MLVAVLGVLAFLAMGAAAVAVVLQMQEREKRQARERELHVAMAENDDLKARMEEITAEKTRADEQLAEARKELNAAKDELGTVAKTRDELQRSIEDREQEIARLTKDLEQIRSDSRSASSQLSALQSERDAAKRQVAELEKAKSDLEAKVLELAERPTVELDKVRVTSDEGGAVDFAGGGLPQPGGYVMPVSTAGGDGQVVVVNREYDFIVMNLGKNHGLSIGQEFQIIRGAEILGRVKVEKIYDELSAAAILPDSKKSSIREGDAVRPL
jgi:chromosome segregation ATPase